MAIETLPRISGSVFSSQRRLSRTCDFSSESCSASNAHTVGATNGSPATPYTNGFPEFHPPPGHIRSQSIASASSLRFSASCDNRSRGNRRIRINAYEVGSTQLLVFAVHAQPQSELFWRVMFEDGERRWRKRCK